jgi:NitT/TauT family transport system substrate-binding protein
MALAIRWLGGSLVVVLLGLACAPARPPATSAGAPAQSAAPAPATAAAPAAAGGLAPLDPPLNPAVTVRVGVVGSASDAGVFIAQEKGYFREQGLEIDLNQFQALQQQVPLLGSGQLDVGGGGLNAGLFNAVAQDVPLRIVADKGSLYPGFRWQGFVVRQDLVDSGAFAGCASFKGMRVANAADGNNAQIQLERLLQECGLSLADIELIVMGYPDMLTAFKNGAIDASHMLEPNITRLASEGLAILYKSSDEVYPDEQAAVLLYGPQFIADQRPAAQRFMLAYVKALRDYWEAFTRGTGRAEVIDILARTTSLKDPALIDRVGPTGLNPDGYVSKPTLAQDVDWWVARGYVKTRVDVAQVVDDSFVDYAIERLGRHPAR